MRTSSSWCTALLASLLMWLVVPVWAADAAGPHVSGPEYGVVDLGDSVPYTLVGSGCAAAHVLIRAHLRGKVLDGPVSQPRAATSVTRCSGLALVPGFAALNAAGWRSGDGLDLSLRAGKQSVPLRYQRIDLARAKVAAGSPEAQRGTDPDTPGQPVISMATGDALDLGRIDLSHSFSVAIRLCIVGAPTPAVPTAGAYWPQAAEAPVRISLREGSPTGEALVGSADLSMPNTFFTVPGGFGAGCWHLVTLPTAHSGDKTSPRLFFVVDVAVQGTVFFNSLDINGTGAKSTSVPRWVTPDPKGMRTIFGGRSFKGWNTSGCALQDGAAVNAPFEQRLASGGVDCAMTYQKASSNQVIRLELRPRHFYDNGAIYVSNEIQVRQQGEYLPGGYIGEYAARWMKLNSWPEWSQVEIVQLGARYVVRVNGRTVTDHLASKGAPAPYQLGWQTQAEWSNWNSNYDAGTSPPVDAPQQWGDVGIRRIRTYSCRSLHDPICVALIRLNEGQAPRA